MHCYALKEQRRNMPEMQREIALAKVIKDFANTKQKALAATKMASLIPCWTSYFTRTRDQT
jgi:hypothetical protein